MYAGTYVSMVGREVAGWAEKIQNLSILLYSLLADIRKQVVLQRYSPSNRSENEALAPRLRSSQSRKRGAFALEARPKFNRPRADGITLTLDHKIKAI
jgi:hypothetical protein